MSDHDHQKQGRRQPIWLAGLIVIGAIFLGSGKIPLNKYFWPAVVSLLVAGHVWIMFKNPNEHEDHDQPRIKPKPPTTTKETGTKNGCC